MDKILSLLLQFREKRDWIQFHSPVNIVKSIVLEAAELLEIFQWKSDSKMSQKEKKMIAEEIADIYNWIVLLAHDLKIDIEKEALRKIKKNDAKYPVEKSRGKSLKYTQL